MSDLTVIVWTGLFTVLLQGIAAYAGLRYLSSRAETALMDKIRTIIAPIQTEKGLQPSDFIRETIMPSVYLLANDYVQGFLKDVHDKPDEYTAVVQPMIDRIVAKTTSNMTGGMISNPNDIGEALKFVPKPIRGIAQLLMAFRGNSGVAPTGGVIKNPLEG